MEAAYRTLLGRKSYQDYSREEEEFNARKRARQQQEQMNQLAMQKGGMELQQMQKELESGVATNDPAVVREWQFYSQLPEQEQQRYLQMKRSDQIMNLGGQMAVRNPTGGIAEAYTVTPKITETPGYMAQQAGAQEAARQGLDYGQMPMTPRQLEEEKKAGRGEITQIEDQTQSRAQVSKMVSDMRSDFIKLAELGAIVDENAGDLENIGRSVGASALGQFYGKITGAEEQTIRKQIDDAKPKLLLAIMRAGGASARGLDSDVELKQWLRTTGDPTSSIQSNLKLMDRLENLIGLSAADNNTQQAMPRAQNTPYDAEETYFNARKAVKAGADPNAVRQRLIENGFDPAKAGL